MINKNFKILFLTITICLFETIATAQADTLLKIFQADSIFSISDTQTIYLKKDSFSFIFYLYDYNDREDSPNTIGIHCSLNKKDFDLLPGENDKEGYPKDSVPFFSLGSGIATEHSKPYKGIYINDFGQHYIMYSKLSTRARRSIPLKEYENKLFKLKWNIPKIFLEKKEILISEINIPQIYIVTFSDINKNNIIEKGEFLRFTLSFQD